MEAGVGLELRKRRQRLGLSLDDVSPVVGVDIGSLSRFERGKRELPRGKTPADYEAALEAIERQQREGAA